MICKLFGHKWNGCKCERCNKVRDKEHNFVSIDEQCIKKCTICGKELIVDHQWEGMHCKICSAPNPNVFCMKVVNKYTAFGNIFVEGLIEYGQLSVGNLVHVYSEQGKLQYKDIRVSAINNDSGIKATSIKMGESKYAAIVLDRLHNFGDVDKNSIITRTKLVFEAPTQKEPLTKEKLMPKAKTYNHADRKTHIKMASNDIASMCASGSLASNREWIRNVGQDIYDVHGFNAMQEVFINVKNRYPMAQSQLSSIWDGVGGWAD